MWDGRGEEGGHCSRGQQGRQRQEELLWPKYVRETGPEPHRTAARRVREKMPWAWKLKFRRDETLRK